VLELKIPLEILEGYLPSQNLSIQDLLAFLLPHTDDMPLQLQAQNICLSHRHPNAFLEDIKTLIAAPASHHRSHFMHQVTFITDSKVCNQECQHLSTREDGGLITVADTENIDKVPKTTVVMEDGERGEEGRLTSKCHIRSADEITHQICIKDVVRGDNRDVVHVLKIKN
jgi:hypothetical protein